MAMIQACIILLYVCFLPDVTAQSCVDVTLVATETTQFLSSPNYPNNYPDNLNCHWTIRAPGATLSVEVISYNIEDDSSCSYDYLQIFESGVALSGKLCGTGDVPTFETGTDTLDVYFTTDDSVQATGFYISYSAVPSGDRIRLAGGSTPNKGRVEIRSGGFWGTICDDQWDINDAHVVCRMLGYYRALSAQNSAFFGQGTGDILMDEVQCTGTEDSIFDCPANPFGSHDCDHNEDAGVICDPYIRPCDDLPDPANGHVTYDMATVIYHCDVGYEVSGTPNRTCADDGTWVGTEPVCTGVRCPLPDDLPNGYYTYAGLQYTNTMTYGCDSGFTYSHPGSQNTFSCGADGQWDYTTFPTFPSCTATCGNNELLTEDHGVLLSPGSPGNYLNRQRCTWALKPKNNHLTLLQLHYFQSEHLYDKLTVYEGSNDRGEVIVSLTGRYFTDDVFSSKTANGFYVVWETDASVTDRGFNLTYWASDCPSPPSISDGASSFSGQLAGATLQYTCDPGHVMIGAPNATCVEGVGWSAPAPSCQIVSCPGVPSASHVVLSSSSCHTYGCTVSYSCSTGFALAPGSPAQTVCQEDGTWSGTGPVCHDTNLIHCPALQAPVFGKIIGNGTAYGTVIEFECKYGFSQGSASRTCQGGGIWSGQDVICNDPKQCEFDTGFCSYYQDSTDDFNWSRTSGTTSSSNTGPNSGYGGSGYYAYIETSSPRQAGDVARLISREEIETDGCSALQFYYHMLGNTIETLNVYIETRTDTVVKNLAWTISGEQGTEWHEARIPFPKEGYHKVIFEGVVGGEIYGDIAIDAIQVVPDDNCTVSTTDQPATTMPITTYPSTDKVPTPSATSIAVTTQSGVTNVTTAPTTPSPPNTIIPPTACRVDYYIQPAGLDIISSPNYPEQYPPNQDCWYVINTDPLYALELNILNFDLQDSVPGNSANSGCTDYVQIHAPLGGTPSQPYCGRDLATGTLLSSPTDTTFAIHFVTDDAGSATGFSAIIRSVLS